MECSLTLSWTTRIGQSMYIQGDVYLARCTILCVYYCHFRDFQVQHPFLFTLTVCYGNVPVQTKKPHLLFKKSRSKADKSKEHEL